MRTKLLLAVIPVGVAALTLTGCGDNANAEFNTDIQRLAVRYDMNQTVGSDLAEADRAYSVTRVVDGVSVPADYTDAALRQDELNVLLAEMRSVQGSYPDASPRQKAIVARMMAEIQYNNAKYLGNAAARSYGPLRAETTGLLPYADRIDSIQGVITIYEGDRDIIIQTLQSGSNEGAIQIAGIDQLRERADEIQSLIDEASQASDGYSQQAQEHNDSVVEYEQLELELRTQARALNGEARFDVLDQAVRAKFEARMAEIEAEYNALLAEVEGANTTLHGDHHTQVQSVIEGLRSRIALVREEIDNYAAEVRTARSDKNTAIGELEGAYDSLDSRFQVLVIDRMDEAITSAAEAVTLYQGRQGGAQSTDRVDTLNAMAMQLQLMYQHGVTLSGYKSALETLAANGETVLGSGLAGAINARITALDGKVTELKGQMETLLTDADEMTSTMRADGEDGLKANFEGQFDSIRSGMGQLPYEPEA